jgi:hypothetical protein
MASRRSSSATLVGLVGITCIGVVLFCATLVGMMFVVYGAVHLIF